MTIGSLRGVKGLLVAAVGGVRPEVGWVAVGEVEADREEVAVEREGPIRAQGGRTFTSTTPAMIDLLGRLLLVAVVVESGIGEAEGVEGIATAMSATTEEGGMMIGRGTGGGQCMVRTIGEGGMVAVARGEVG